MNAGRKRKLVDEPKERAAEAQGSPEDRPRVRQERSRPLIIELEAWLREQRAKPRDAVCVRTAACAKNGRS